MVIDELYGADSLAPLRLRLTGDITVERSTNAHIAFFHVHKQIGPIQPWAVRGKLTIERMADCRVLGVVVDEHEAGEE